MDGAGRGGSPHPAAADRVGVAPGLPHVRPEPTAREDHGAIGELLLDRYACGRFDHLRDPNRMV